MEQQYRILVGAIPIRDERVLVLQRSKREKFMPGTWGLPCGKIDFGEDLESAVLRELKEEAGIDGKVVRMVGYSMFMSEREGVQLHNVQINFLIQALSDSVILDRSNDAYEWIPLEAYRSSELDEFTVSTIAQAL